MERFGCKVKMLPAVSPEALADCRVLVIGRQCVVANGLRDGSDRSSRGPADECCLWIRRKRVSSPASLFLEKRNSSIRVSSAQANHPVMRGLKDVDFAMWNPDHLIAKGLYRTPNCGNFLSLVQCFNLDRQSQCHRPGRRSGRCTLAEGRSSSRSCRFWIPLAQSPWPPRCSGDILDYLGKDVYRHPQCSLAVCDNVSDLC